MPAAKVCLWNIQNYGSGETQRKAGADSDLRNRFIRDFVRANQIDVLLIQEVSTNAANSLGDLMSKLNTGLPLAQRDWVVSYCGSALTNGSADPPADQNELTFASDARHEGYAVAWRSDQGARYTMVPGLNPIDTDTFIGVSNPNPPAGTPLNMSTRGRPTGNVINAVTGDVNFDALGGYVSALGNTVPYSGGAPMAAWPTLDFPSTANANPETLRWEGARRPAYVVMNLAVNGGTASDRLCPVAAYHAPSNKAKAEWGGLVAGLARELYVTNTLLGNGDPNPAGLVYARRVVLGGDFNYSVAQNAWPAWYRFFTAGFQTGPLGGAACSAAPAPTLNDEDRRTTVQLLEGQAHDQIITSANLDAYLRHKIDLAFFRRNTGITGARVYLPAQLMVNGNPYAATLQAYRAHLNAQVAALNPAMDRMDPGGTGPQRWVRTRDPRTRRWRAAWKPLLCGAWGGTFVNWNTFMTDLNNGYFGAARQAAEFFHIFISDHLPLVVTLNY